MRVVSHSTPSRRSFLKAGAVVAAAAYFVPSRLLGQRAPGNRILMGCIGVGRMGQNDMKELIYRGLDANARVIAVCDVDSKRARDARNLVREIYQKELQQDDWDCKVFGDFRL